MTLHVFNPEHDIALAYDNKYFTAPHAGRQLRNDLAYAMKYRYACKKFDSAKKISDDDWNAILESGRLAPTSLGFEAFRLQNNRTFRFAQGHLSQGL